MVPRSIHGLGYPMPKTKTIKAAKAQRARDGVTPANWQWRDGRPRWIPSPTLRQAGWRGRDLQDPRSGAWLAMGASMDAAGAINQAIGLWKKGQLVPALFADIAPPNACAKPRLTDEQKLERHSVGALIDAWGGAKNKDGSWRVEPSNEFSLLAPRTQVEYRSKLKRLVEALAGYYKPLPRDAGERETEAYVSAVREIRALSVKYLQTPEEDEDGDSELYTVYWGLRKHCGLHQADGVLRTTSAWLEWCKSRKRAIRSNPVTDVDRVTLPGRLRPATWDELKALIEAAERLGYASIADSIILGIDLSWSEIDRLQLTWSQISAEHRVRTRRVKTNRPGETPLLDALGVPRLAKIRARQRQLFGETVHPTHVLICETTRQPWGSSHYQVTLAEIRREAAKTVPSAGDVLDKDLRSTAVCVAYEAGLSKIQIAGRTLHSLRQIEEILDKHYGAIGREVSDQGAALLNTYLKAKGISL